MNLKKPETQKAAKPNQTLHSNRSQTAYYGLVALEARLRELVVLIFDPSCTHIQYCCSAAALLRWDRNSGGLELVRG